MRERQLKRRPVARTQRERKVPIIPCLSSGLFHSIFGFDEEKNVGTSLAHALDALV